MQYIHGFQRVVVLHTSLGAINKCKQMVTAHPTWAICSGRRRNYLPVGLALASLPKTLPSQTAHVVSSDMGE